VDLKETLFRSLIQDQIVFDDYNTASEYYTQSIKENTKCPSLHTIDGYFIPGSMYPFIWTPDLLSVSSKNKPKFKIKLFNIENGDDHFSDKDSVSEKSKSNKEEEENDSHHSAEEEESNFPKIGRELDSPPPRRDAEVLNVAKIEESPEDDSFLNRRNISNLILISSSCLMA